MTKDYTVVPVGRLYKIKWAGGGQLAKELSGLYTSHNEIKKAIEKYEKKKPATKQTKRGVKNGTGKDAARA